MKKNLVIALAAALTFDLLAASAAFACGCQSPKQDGSGTPAKYAAGSKENGAKRYPLGRHGRTSMARERILRAK